MTKEYFQKLNKSIKEARSNGKVYPEPKLVLNAFNLTPYHDLKVVFLGDKCLPSENEMGLAFSSIGHETPSPQKLIRKEIEADIYPLFERAGKPFIGWKTNNLAQWSRQGILLFNNYLTSDNNPEWTTFTLEFIKWINEHQKNLVFILIGNNVNYKHYLSDRHLVITGNTITGTKAFSKTNNFLIKNNREPINWSLLN